MTTPPASPDDARRDFLPNRWKELEPLVDEVLGAAPSEREALIGWLCGEDSELFVALTAMVADCERELPRLDVPALEQFAQLIADEPEQPLPDLLGDRYRIERELGRGGMARVFLALDVKHGRHVAVKVIRPDLAASLGRERFLREIAIAARLRHPNIVPLYDSGDANGMLYFVMPYEEGQSLRQRLDQTAPMVASEYLGVLRDVARALAYAHEHGVVHRDIKPDNVMLSGGAVVVADFGIAKAVSVAQGGTGSTTTLTQTGSGIGTPTYMAPEQAVGDPATDHRADIYSFGCLAYELISGKPPFHNLPLHQLIAAHVATVPVAIGTVAPDVDERLASLVMQCLEKEPADRPQKATEVLDQLDATATDERMRSAAPRRVPAVKRRALGAVLAIAVASVGMAVWGMRRAPDVTVAVLPLQSASEDPEQRALAEGLSDEVSSELVHVPGLKVMSRLGVANYRDAQKFNAANLGHALGARFLVTGSFRELNGRLRVLVQLVSASDGTVLWSDSFDRAQNELSVVRYEIARAIGDTLGKLVPASARLGRAAAAKPARVVNDEAFRLYVLAQRVLLRRAGGSIQASVVNFQQAIALDSNYAEAWAGLSLARELTPIFVQQITHRAIEPAVRAAAARALALDSTLATPHVALAIAHQYAYRWDSAGTEYHAALRLRTAGDVEPLIQYGKYLMYRGRVREGMQQLMLARQTEPASAVVSSWLGYAYYLEGQLDSALVEIRRAYQSDSTMQFLRAAGPLILLRAGMISEVRRMAENGGPDNPLMALVLAAQGDSSLAFALLRRPEHANDTFLMLAVGDTTSALIVLERKVDAHDPWAAAFPVLDARYAALWPSARFRALLRRVGLGDVVFPAPRKN